MFTLSVKTDVRGTVDYLNRVKNGLGDRAITSSLNKTAAQAKTQMARGITSEYAISAALVRERLVLRRASRSGQQFTATLVGNPANRNKRAMNVIHFLERVVSLAEGKRRRKGGTLNVLRFKIRRTGGKQVIRGAFIGNKGRTIFRRVSKDRLDIVPVQTIGIPQMFNAKKVQLPVQRWITENFPRIFDRDVRYFLSTVR